MPGVITVRLPDGSAKELPNGATALDLARAIGPRLAAASVAATVDGQAVDLDHQLADGSEVAVVTSTSDPGRTVLRHSTAHVLAQAVLELWPGARYAIGPAIADGFYYDFDLPGGATFSDDDLGRIDARMRAIVAEDQPFVREEHTVEEGLTLFADQPYKIEIIQGVGQDAELSAEAAADIAADANAVSVYRNTEQFVDLCRGPHVPSTGRLGHFALLRVAGAYWRGDEHGPQLQRIYGTAWESDAALAEHLHRLEEAEQARPPQDSAPSSTCSRSRPRSARVWRCSTPKGRLIRSLMEDYSRRAPYRRWLQLRLLAAHHQVRPVRDLRPPGLVRRSHVPAHGARRGPALLPQADELPVAHSHLQVAGSAPTASCRCACSSSAPSTATSGPGVVHGLTRVRGITQDDAHIFCTREQMAGELTSLAGLRPRSAAGLRAGRLLPSCRPGPRTSPSAATRTGTRPPRLWRAVATARDPELVMDEGGGAFYAPKIDVHVARRHRPALAGVDPPGRLPAARSASTWSTSAPTTAGTGPS